ncbi:MAG: glycosyltransferase, partial [Planctomycetes bacterium]|nr:glycosyltransferase [Planctomycetota bacterium]
QGRRCGDPPRISVIIPSLDGSRGGNVPLLLSDLAAQTEQDFEVFVVIGVRPNGRARNVGVRQAAGRYVVSIDDDVRLGDEHVFENLVRPFEERSDVGLTGASQLLPLGASALENRATRELPRFHFPVQERLVDTDQVSHLCLAMPRELYWQLGGENEEIPSGTDPDLRQRVRRAGLRVVVVPRTWAYHPAPRSLRRLLATCYRKARDSRWVSRHFPGLALDVPAGVGGAALQERPPAWRAGRLILAVMRGLLEMRLLFVAARLAWAAGWLYERLFPRPR